MSSSPVLPLYLLKAEAYGRLPAHEMISPHRILYIVLHGPLVLALSGREVRLEEGTFILVPPGAAHKLAFADECASGEKGALLSLEFGGPAAEGLLLLLQLKEEVPWQLADLTELRALHGRLAESLSEETEEAAIARSAETYIFLLTLCKHLRHPPKPKPKPEAAASGNAALMQTAMLLGVHDQEPAAWSEIARLVGYSPSHLHRLFREHFGMSAKQYLTAVRMRHAAALIDANPDMKIQSVAGSVGMDGSYFNRVFRQTFGMTPGSYKNRRTRQGP